MLLPMKAFVRGRNVDTLSGLHKHMQVKERRAGTRPSKETREEVNLTF